MGLRIRSNASSPRFSRPACRLYMLMGADETGMLARLKDHHRELIDSMNRQSFFC
jgi:hypothetical protein